MFRQILGRIAAGRIDDWVARHNEVIDEEWALFKKTAGERQGKLETLELELKNLPDVGAAVGNDGNVAERIQEVTAAIHDPRDLQNCRKPSKLAAADLVRRAERVVELCRSGRHSDRKAVARLYMRELSADPEIKTLTDTLVEPVMIPDMNEDPDPDSSGSLVCGYVVEQALGIRTRLFVELTSGVTSIAVAASPVSCRTQDRPQTTLSEVT